MKTIFVVGAGKGLGNAVARRFGREGFRVVLLARNAEHLAEYQKEFADNGMDVDVQVVDVSSPESVEHAFDALHKKYGAPDVLFCNVGITAPDEPTDVTEKKADLLADRYQTDVLGAYRAIQQVLGSDFSDKNGTILLTGGGLSMYPMYEYLPLSMDKAALRAMTKALHDELKKQNVHVGTVTVTGSIEPGSKWDPNALAEDFWKLSEDRDDWEIVH